MHIVSALEKGYLPKELPPCFSSASFATSIGSITKPPDKNWTYPVRFSLNRAGGIRRSLEIPNPFSQYFIVAQCSAHWETLRRITGRSQISLSRPLRGGNDRSLRYRTPMDRWSRELIARMPGGRVTLKTDISQFYPSIYTHAVDWSIRGKARAKKDLKGSGLGPNLDKLLRNSRGGQTIGLSVGPDTSWVVAELVLANIDAGLAQKFPRAIRRTARFGDDMTVYASSLGEADEILAAYQVLLLECELAINPVKASIIDGLLPVEASWVRKLRAHQFRDDRDYNLTADVIDLFDVAFEERAQHPTQGVLSYAIKRCNPFPAGVDSWPVYRDLVMASAGVESSTLPHAYAVLEFAYRHGLLVDKSRVSEILNQLIVDHAKLEHGFETSWILYMIRSLSLDLDSSSARAVSMMNDNCSLILLRDLCSRSKRLTSDVSFDAAVARAERSDALSSNDWLLAYEYRHNGWCRPKSWDHQPSWKELHKSGVDFLLKTGRPPKKVLRRMRPSFIASWLYGP